MLTASPVTSKVALGWPAWIVALEGTSRDSPPSEPVRVTLNFERASPPRVTVIVPASLTLTATGPLRARVVGGTITLRFVLYELTLALIVPDPLETPRTRKSPLTWPAGIVSELALSRKVSTDNVDNRMVRLAPDSLTGRRIVTVLTSPTRFVRGLGVNVRVGLSTMTARFVP